MSVPSLYELAKRQLIRNITLLEDVGGLPYDFLRPILIKIQNPAQLHRIEKQCPQIAESSGEIWLRFMHRNFQNAESLLPENISPDSVPKGGWYRLYNKIKTRSEEALHESELALKAQLSALQTQKASNTTKYVEHSLDPLRKKKSRPFVAGSHAPVDRSLRGVPAGKAAVIKAKRNVAALQQHRAQARSQAQHVTPQRSVVRAPIGMVNDHKRAPPLKEVLSPTSARNSRTMPQSPDQPEAGEASSREETHDSSRRLAGMTGVQSSPAKPAYLPARTTSTSTHVSPEKAERVSLPADTKFDIPQMRSTLESTNAGVAKRKRPAKNIFMPAKKR